MGADVDEITVLIIAFGCLGFIIGFIAVMAGYAFLSWKDDSDV